MSTAFNAVGPSATGSATLAASTATWSHTVGAGSNRYLLAAVAVGFFSTDTSPFATTTATFNGVAMTSLGKVLANNSRNGYIELFGLVAPASGAHNVVVTCSKSATSLAGGSLDFSSAKQSNPTNIITNFGSGGTAVAIMTGGHTTSLFAGTVCAGNNITTTENWTNRIRNNASTQSGAGCMAVSTTTGTTSGNTQSYGVTSGDWWGVILAEIEQAAAGQTVVVGTAAESDSARPVPGKKARSAAFPTETDAALHVNASKVRIVGRAAETELALPVGKTKKRTVGMAAEFDSAQPLSGGHSMVVSRASEADLAMSVGVMKHIPVGMATETDSALEVGMSSSNFPATLKRLITKGSGGSSLPAPFASYDFSEGTGLTVTDRSGGGRDGTISNQFHFTWGDGDLSSSGGSTDLVSIPTDSGLEFTDNFAIMCNIIVPGDYPSGDKVLVSKSRTSSADSYALYARTSDNGHFPEMLVSNGVSTFFEAIHDTDIMDNTKHHLCGVYDGTNVLLYVDGVLSATTPCTGDVEYADGLDLTFLGSAAWPTESIEATIDDVRILDFAPTADQVAEYASTGVDEDSSTPNVWAAGATLRKWNGTEWDPALPVNPSTLDETNTGARIATTAWTGAVGPIYLTQAWLDDNNGGSNVLSGWDFTAAGFNIGAGAEGITGNQITFSDCIFHGIGEANASVWINSELSGDEKPAGFKVILEYIEWDGQGEVTWEIAETFIRGGDWSALRVNCHDGCGLYRGNSDNIFIQECYGHDQADVPTGETVLNANTDFSVDTTNWTQVGSVLTRDTGTVHSPATSSGKIIPDGSTSDVYIISEKVDVIASRSYHAHAWFNSPTGYDQCYININWFDSGGAYISTTASDVYDLAAATWTEVEVTADSPPGAASASVIADESGTPAGTDILYVSEITIAAEAVSPHTSCIGILSGNNVTVRDSKWSTGTADNIGSTGALVTLAEQQGDSDNINFINNSAEGGSYSMYCGATGAFTLTNSIFADNFFPRNIHRLSGTFGTNTAFVSNSGSNIFRNNRWGILGPFNEDGDPAEGELVEIG